jgi:phage/plasmid-associated DNA primase
MENPKNKSSSQHDSGGIGSVVDCRFVSIQEPDIKANDGKIDASRIKELTSGSPIVFRMIFESSRTKNLNVRFMFQTNSLPGFSEYGTAMTRRTAIYQFKKKFIAKNIEDKFVNVENISEAKTDLNGRLFDDPEFATHYFMFILPYICEFVKRGITSISDIPIPKCVDNDTRAGFNQINEVFKFCNDYISKYNGRILNIRNLSFKIYERTNSCATRSSGKLNDIMKSIEGYFQGSIYKLQSQYYVRDNAVSVDTYKVESTQCDTNEEIIEMYFNNKALADMSQSKVKDKEDLYIVGYEMNENLDGNRQDVTEIVKNSDLYDNDPYDVFMSTRFNK